MAKAQFFFSRQYDSALRKIEDFIFAQSGSPADIEAFLGELDKAFVFLGQNPGAAAVNSATGDQSWPFSGGRYRIFFVAVTGGDTVQIFLTDIIDNRQANLHVYPGNSIPTYDEE